MKLGKITIENYRGFYGENSIEFETNAKGRNINLVVARNDTGKTTLLNSIYWCLYGEEQFYSAKQTEKRIASNKKIGETPVNEKFRVRVSITLNDEKGPKYQISRQRTYRRMDPTDDKVKVNPLGADDFTGLERKTGDTGWQEISHMGTFIGSNMPKGISTFFLLDGEQLKVIFASDINYKIKESIERVANITAINNMIDTLKGLDKSYSRKRSDADPDFGKVQTELERCDNLIEERSAELKKLITANEANKTQKNEIENFLIGHDEASINDLGNREKRLKEDNARLNSQRLDKQKELDVLSISTFITHISQDVLNETLEKFEEVILGGEFPPAVDSNNIKQLLKRKECICGTKIGKGSEAEAKLKKLADRESFKQYVRIISEGDSRLPEMISALKSDIEKISMLRQEMGDCESVLEKNEAEIVDIWKRLADSDIDEIREKGEERQAIERQILRNQSDIANTERDIEDLKVAKSECETKINQISIKAQKNELLDKKLAKCRELILYSKEIREGILKEIKDKIESTTAENFINLHWKADEYEKVKISDNFSLSILDKNQGEIINELSQGAALCFGLAFMTALRNYSGYDVPIIIDSPVGKIDEGNRKRIAETLPKQLGENQVIFLVTGSEYTSVFRETIDKKIANKVNLVYNKQTREIDIQ